MTRYQTLVVLFLFGLFAVSGCTYNGRLKRGFHKPMELSGGKRSGRVVIIEEGYTKPSLISLHDSLCSVQLNIDVNPNFVRALSDELGSLFEKTEVVPTRQDAGDAAIAVLSRFSLESGDLNVSLVVAETDEPLGEYHAKAKLDGRFMCGGFAYWFAPLSFFTMQPLLTGVTGRQYRNIHQTNISYALKDIGKQIRQNPDILAYPKNRAIALKAKEKGNAVLDQRGPQRAFRYYGEALKHTWFGHQLDRRIRESYLKLRRYVKIASRSPKAEAAYAQGDFLFNKGKYAEAVAPLTKAVTLAPWWTGVYYRLAQAQQYSGQFKAASNSLNFYLLGNPKAAHFKSMQKYVYEMQVAKTLDSRLANRPGIEKEGAADQAPIAKAPPTRAAPRKKWISVDNPRYTSPMRPDHYALLVGIEKYSEVVKADFAERDVEAVRRHLLASGFPERNIVMLKGMKATLGSLQSYLEEWLPRNVKKNSTVLFYYSGHGAPDTETGEAYLVPWDGNPQFLKSTAYPLKRLYASISKLKAKNKVVLLDSCFSGSGGRSVLAEGMRPLVIKIDDAVPRADGLTVLTAASGDQITSGIKNAQHGIFTYYFLRALGGEARDSAGRITLKTIYDYLRPKVQDEARRQNREQQPQYQSSAGDLTLRTEKQR